MYNDHKHPNCWLYSLTISFFLWLIIAIIFLSLTSCGGSYALESRERQMPPESTRRNTIQFLDPDRWSERRGIGYQAIYIYPTNPTRVIYIVLDSTTQHVRVIIKGRRVEL